MNLSRSLALFSAVALTSSIALAQSTIYGADVRLQRFFTTDTGNFVTNFAPVAAPGINAYFAIDFDETGTTLWTINNTTLSTGTMDLTTGVVTPSGNTVTAFTTGATGLTCATDGTWYASTYNAAAAATFLYVGDVTTGAFTLVGQIATGIVIDISIDSQGNLYGHSISNDSLYSIDTTTGLGTLLGSTGQPLANFAQGMDFDWSTDTLYATIYTGGGTGVFASMDLTTGFANVLEITTPLNAEMEIAIPELPPAGSVTPYCTSGTTSAGCVPVLSASNAPSASGAGSPCITTCSSMEENRNGLMFFGLAELNPAAPWAAGSTSFLCVKSPTNRTTPGTSSIGPNPADPCEGSMSLDFSAWIVANPVHLGTPHVSGQTLYCQQWYRDPATSKTTGLSNGLALTFAP